MQDTNEENEKEILFPAVMNFCNRSPGKGKMRVLD
jgi:hypothetical protein